MEEFEVMQQQWRLELNKQNNIYTIIFIVKEKPEGLKGMEVVKNNQYLGITVTHKVNCFNKQKNRTEKARK